MDRTHCLAHVRRNDLSSMYWNCIKASHLIIESGWEKYNELVEGCEGHIKMAFTESLRKPRMWIDLSFMTDERYCNSALCGYNTNIITDLEYWHGIYCFIFFWHFLFSLQVCSTEQSFRAAQHCPVGQWTISLWNTHVSSPSVSAVMSLTRK